MDLNSMLWCYDTDLPKVTLNSQGKDISLPDIELTIYFETGGAELGEYPHEGNFRGARRGLYQLY